MRRQAEFDEVLALLGQGKHRQPGFTLDALDRRVHPLRRFGGEHEPHVEGVLATVVVRDLGQGIDPRGHFVEALLGHAQRREHEAAADALDLEQRTEAGQHAAREQAPQPLDQLLLVEADLGRDGRERPLVEREAAVQPVDQAGVDGVNGVGGEAIDKRFMHGHGHPPPSLRGSSVPRSA